MARQLGVRMVRQLGVQVGGGMARCLHVEQMVGAAHDEASLFSFWRVQITKTMEYVASYEVCWHGIFRLYRISTDNCHAWFVFSA